MSNIHNLDVTRPDVSDRPKSAAAAPRQRISLGLSEAFYNKTLRRGYTDQAFGSSFAPTTITPAALCAHILAGKAWTPGYFRGSSRTNKTFDYAELVALDADAGLSVAEALQSPLIRQYALLVHPSASSSEAQYRTRVVFVLSEPVEKAERYRALVAGLIQALNLKFDPASIKPAQLYFGSTNRIEAPYVNLDAVLPVGLLGELTHDAALDEMLRSTAVKLPTIKPRTAVAERRSADRVERSLNKIVRASVGERHDTLVKQSWWLFGMQKGGWPVGDIENELRQTALRVMGDDRAREIERVLKWAATEAAPVALELPTEQARGGNGSLQPICVVQAETPTELFLGQIPRLMICCPEYVLIDLLARRIGCADGFTASQIAASAGISQDTAQNWINKALEWEAVSRRSEELKTIGKDKDIIFNSAERQSLRGAAVARLYCLTPEVAAPHIDHQLPDRVQALMEWGEPAVIRQAEALSIGLDADASAKLELITDETSRTLDAFEVSANAERAAWQKAREITQWAELDATPFRPDQLPKSVRELRTMLIEALIATKPEKRWTHSELMWVAGVKRGSVSALIQKSNLVPVSGPAVRDVPLLSGDPHRAVRVLSSRYRGVPIAWLDADGQVICKFSSTVPHNAKGVRLSVGKKYRRRDQVEILTQQEDLSPAQPEVTEAETMEQAQPTQTRKRAKRGVVPGLSGCLAARGWKYMPGPYGYWFRGSLTYPNTAEGMAEALLLDFESACELRERRACEDQEHGCPEFTDRIYQSRYRPKIPEKIRYLVKKSMAFIPGALRF